jgi:hypothetical protein
MAHMPDLRTYFCFSCKNGSCCSSPFVQAKHVVQFDTDPCHFVAAFCLSFPSYTTTLAAYKGAKKSNQNHHNPLGHTSDRHDLQELAKDAEGQSTPIQPKRGPASKPPPSPIDIDRFDEDFHPDLAMLCEGSSPANLGKFRKEVAKELADGAKDITDFDTARAYKHMAGIVMAAFTHYMLINRFNQGRDQAVKVAQMAERDPEKTVRMSEDIKVKVDSPGPKESDVADDLVQVCRATSPRGGPWTWRICEKGWTGSS